jgi:WD40 repeat protein
MRDDVAGLEAASGPSGAEPRSGRAGHTRSAAWNLSRIGLLLALAIVLAWLPIHRWEPASGPTRRVTGPSRVPIMRLVFGPDGRTLATTDESGRATLWDADEILRPGRALEVRGHARPIAYSPDGHHLAIGGDEPDVAWWDLAGAPRHRMLGIPVRWTADLKISPDGRSLAVSSHDSPAILLWDLDSGRERMTLRGHSAVVIHMAFAPDGLSLASAAASFKDRAIVIWDLAAGRPERRITAPGSTLSAMAYSPDGRLIAGASSDERPVRIWDVRTGGQILMIAGHSQPTFSVAFSPDGCLLATAAGDGAAGLWSVATGRELRRLDGRADMLRNVAFSPDGKTLAATGNDGDIRLWDVDDLIRRVPDR